MKPTPSDRPRRIETVSEVAHILALGFLRARKRQAARTALAGLVGSGANALDDVPPQATLATRERRTSETGGDA